jgi:hypothetical protein
MIRLLPRFHQSFVARVSNPSKGAFVYVAFSVVQLKEARKMKVNHKKYLIAIDLTFHIPI